MTSHLATAQVGYRKIVPYLVWVVIIPKGGPCLHCSRQQSTWKNWQEKKKSLHFLLLCRDRFQPGQQILVKM